MRGESGRKPVNVGGAEMGWPSINGVEKLGGNYNYGGEYGGNTLENNKTKI